MVVVRLIPASMLALPSQRQFRHLGERLHILLIQNFFDLPLNFVGPILCQSRLILKALKSAELLRLLLR